MAAHVYRWLVTVSYTLEIVQSSALFEIASLVRMLCRLVSCSILHLILIPSLSCET